jgi:parallel beta-helix repeat protein
VGKAPSSGSANYASVLTLTGVGNEDAKINAWLAANSPLGVKKLVGSGTLGANINPPAGTYLDGTAASLILANGATWNGVTVLTGADDVTVVGLTLDGNRANTAYGQNGLYTVANRTRFLDCHVKNFNGYNIVGFPGATDLLVRGCVSEGPASEGIEFQGVVRGSIINNVVRNTGRNGIYVWGSSGTCSDITVTGNVVFNASAENPSGAGIRVDDGAYNITVAGNSVTGGGTTVLGINVGSSTAARVKNVTVEGNAVRATPDRGIRVYVADHVTVTGNTVSGAATYGIEVTSGATDVTVAANTVTGSVAYSGILVSGGASDCAITGNKVSASGQHNIEISGLLGGSVTGNVVSTSGTSCNGIFVYGASSGLSITGNEASLSGRAGIRVEDAINCTIVGNVCKNGGKGGNVALSTAINITKASGTCSGHTVAYNRCFDDQGSKTQYYGLRIVGAVDNVVIGPNLLTGNGVGGPDAYVDPTATNISASVYKKIPAQTVGVAQTTIAHGLPYIPQSVTVAMTSAGTVWRSAASDATNIYLTADAAARTCDIYVG